MNSPSRAAKKRYATLDLFRVICALAVCAFHTTIHLGCQYGVFQAVSQMGAVFMTAFFLLSGFSLYLNYHSVNLIDLSQFKFFLLKRVLSLFPMYYFASIIYLLFFGKETIFQNLLLAPIECLALQSVFSSLFSVSHNGGTWFISCIFLCYIIYPFIQSLVIQLSPRSKFSLIILFGSILLYAPIIVRFFHTQDIYSNPFFRILEFSIGILLASLYQQHAESAFFKRYIFTPRSIVLAALVFYFGVTVAVKLNIGIGNYMLYSWIVLPLFSILLFSLAGLDSRRLETSSILHYMSQMSYSFFLAQLFSNTICKKIIFSFSLSSNLYKIILGWGVCIAIAVLLHECIEKRLVYPLKAFLLRHLT